MRAAAGRSPGTAAAQLLALAAAALLAYGGGLSGPFVFDDQGAIQNNATLRELWPPWPALRGPAFGNALAGRPLSNLSFAVTHAAFGLEPWGHRAVNLAIHVGCGWLAALALGRALRLPCVAQPLRERAGPLAFAVALLWTLHPLTSEVVLYTAQRTEALVSLFALLVFVCFLRAQESPRPGAWRAGAVGACAAAMACKETAAVVPLLLLLFDRAFGAGSLRSALALRGRFYAALAATWTIPAALALRTPRGRSAELFSADYLLAQGEIVLDYLHHALWPARLVFDYGPLIPGQAAAGPAAVVALLAAAGGLWAWRSPRAGFAALWWFGLLAPSSSFAAVHSEVGAERRVYLALLAPLALCTVWAATLWLRALPRLRLPAGAARAAAVIALLVPGVLLGARTRARCADYASELSIWQSAVEARPQNLRAWFNLGNMLQRDGRGDAAEQAYRRALALLETDDAHLNLGILLAHSGRSDEALIHLRRATELESPTHPRKVNARLNLALVLGSRGQNAEGLQQIDHALARRPHREDRLRLAEALDLLGAPERALAALEPLLAQDPPDADAAALRAQIQRAGGIAR